MKYSAKILWQKKDSEIFTDGKYNRVHEWLFDGGMRIAASPSPSVVPLPMSDDKLIDPEEAFVASISSCHMLFFLSIAARRKLIVNHYEDNAGGIMGKNEEGKMAMLSVTLNPVIIFSEANIPSQQIIDAIHEEAHESCFIANSVKTTITVNSK